MERPLVGSIVVVEFPYSGYVGAKKRPALCLGYSGERDVILCQITSQNYHYERIVVPVDFSDFESGKLPIEKSYVRPDKIFTFETGKVIRTAGQIKKSTLLKIGAQLRETFKAILE